jgi:hypothetical protein
MLDPIDDAPIRQSQCVGVRAAIEKGVVDASDIQNRFPGYKGIHRKKQGSILCRLRFMMKVGVKNSSVKSRKGGYIGVYKITDMNRALEFLKQNELNTGRP